jgi:hypothetical protein
MAIIVSAPEAFFDAEPWSFDLTINQPDGSGPMDLTGSRLFVAFRSLADNAVVGVCDTTSNDGSLAIIDPVAGAVRFFVQSAGRKWRLPACMPGGLMLKSTVVGDLFRLPPGQGGSFRGIGRIEIPVLPSTGLPGSTGSHPACGSSPAASKDITIWRGTNAPDLVWRLLTGGRPFNGEGSTLILTIISGENRIVRSTANPDDGFSYDSATGELRWQRTVADSFKILKGRSGLYEIERVIDGRTFPPLLSGSVIGMDSIPDEV